MRGTVLLRVGWLISIALWPSVVWSQTGQAQSRGVQDWTIRYVLVGGIAGVTRSISLGHDGRLVVTERFPDQDVDVKASAGLITKGAAFVRSAREIKSTNPNSQARDVPHATLTVCTAGREYPVDFSPDGTALLTDARREAITQAISGAWSQSGWKPCTPLERLTAAEVDPPIEDLRLT